MPISNTAARIPRLRVSEDIYTNFDSRKAHLRFAIQPINETIWANISTSESAYVTTSKLTELSRIADIVAAEGINVKKNIVLRSQRKGVFSLGGDLAFFRQCIESRDRESLADYGHKAIKSIYSNMRGCGSPNIKTLAVVQGEAQGGGFEAALSCHLIIAEKGTYFGFPERLFGLFPGMGGLALLKQRTDSQIAQRIMSSAVRYSAEFLHDIGVIDVLTNPGEGMLCALEVMTSASHDDIFRLRKEQLSNIPYSELLESVEAWIASALARRPNELRAMKYVCEAQQKLLNTPIQKKSLC